ncbi:hypothetical protein AVEN_230131-1 [Araneus ventricosus]|uniref:Uncharacterized protein n=1 Tax=Araneus ventricosus TaxID=182803 RepID=A0A4Y2IGQ7_ARAVE|nr:hypothetical protein AVEN_230131-1 [Araneus ventricosus]
MACHYGMSVFGPHSYKTVSPAGKSLRCHIDQMRNRKTQLVSSQSSTETQENSTVSAASSAIPSISNTPIKPSDQQLKLRLLRRPLMNPINDELYEPTGQQ